MIELTPLQRQQVCQSETVVIDPDTQQIYVLVLQADFDRLKGLSFDDSPWTDDEMSLLAAEAGELLDGLLPSCNSGKKTG